MADFVELIGVIWGLGVTFGLIVYLIYLAFRWRKKKSDD